jgi:hypothetical protein
MKSIILSAVLSALLTLNLTGQSQGPITMGKQGRVLTYQQNGKYLTFRELGDVLKLNTESFKEYKKTETLDKTGGMFLMTGIISSSAVVVYSGLSLIARLDNNKDKAYKYLTNAGIIFLSDLGLIIMGNIILDRKEAHMRKSINYYNNTLKTGRTENVIIYIGFTGEGVGVRLRF